MKKIFLGKHIQSFPLFDTSEVVELKRTGTRITPSVNRIQSQIQLLTSTQKDVEKLKLVLLFTSLNP